MNNTTSDETLNVFDDHIALRIVRLILYPAVFIIGVIGNLTVCALIVKAKSKQFHSAEGYFILNLALSDLLVLFLYLPFDLAYLENHSIWRFGLVLCKLINVLTSISVTVSATMLICIGFERYTTIIRTLTGRLSKRKALVMVAFGWMYSCLSQIPYVFALRVEPNGKCLVEKEWWPSPTALNLTFIMAIIMPQFVIPACCLTFFYLAIVCHVWKAHRLNSKRGIYMNAHVAEKRVKQNRKTTKLLSGLVLVYAACILPHMIIIVILMTNHALLLSPFMAVIRQLYEFARLLKTANSCLNPILYTLLSRGFRKDLKRLCVKKSESNNNSSLRKVLRSRAEDHQALSPSHARFYGTITVKLENGNECEREDRV